MWLGMNHVIRANHMISLITSSTTDPRSKDFWFDFHSWWCILIKSHLCYDYLPHLKIFGSTFTRGDVFLNPPVLKLPTTSKDFLFDFYPWCCINSDMCYNYLPHLQVFYLTFTRGAVLTATCVIITYHIYRFWFDVYSIQHYVRKFIRYLRKTVNYPVN
jgi:hypothetical protein